MSKKKHFEKMKVVGAREVVRVRFRDLRITKFSNFAEVLRKKWKFFRNSKTPVLVKKKVWTSSDKYGGVKPVSKSQWKKRVRGVKNILKRLWVFRKTKEGSDALQIFFGISLDIKGLATKILKVFWPLKRELWHSKVWILRSSEVAELA